MYTAKCQGRTGLYKIKTEFSMYIHSKQKGVQNTTDNLKSL